MTTSKCFVRATLAATLSLSVLLSFFGCASHPQINAKPADVVVAKSSAAELASLDPVEIWGELFVRVQLAPVFPDSKVFVDMTPKSEVSEILAAFKKENPVSKEALTAFVARYFAPPQSFTPVEPVSDEMSKATVSEHIKTLWPQLTREADSGVIDASSLIPLPFSYVVPGGRFREIYYWDSYFTQLGLLADNEELVFKNMVKNFSHLLISVGRIPNGNRDYYRGRSQPPFFSLMVALWADHYGLDSAKQFLPALKKEHDFWMEGARAVKIDDEALLNRYWDDKAAPRPEAYKEDVALANSAKLKHGRPLEETYRDLRAGAESGWDYSTRWFKDPSDFATIQTTAYLPVDLNALLFHLETTLAKLSEASGEAADAVRFHQLAGQRKTLIQTLLWDEKSGTFRDYDLKTQKLSSEETIATVVPLFVGVATEAQAKKVARVVEKKFLKLGGVVTTSRHSGQQWDAPNGWAPHQWMAYAGLKRYGATAVANKIKSRWLSLNAKVFRSTGKLMEKYNVEKTDLKSGGGEYPTQDGFGWTNGVYRALESGNASTKHLEVFVSL